MASLKRKPFFFSDVTRSIAISGYLLSL